MKAHRAARLRELLRHLSEDEEEARRIYMRKTGYTKGRVSQQLTKGFGERAGMTIAGKLNLADARWFERPLGTPRMAPPPPPGHLRVVDPDGRHDYQNLPAFFLNTKTHRGIWPLPSVPPEVWAGLPPDRKRDIDIFAAGIARGFGAPADGLGGPPGSTG